MVILPLPKTHLPPTTSSPKPTVGPPVIFSERKINRFSRIYTPPFGPSVTLPGHPPFPNGLSARAKKAHVLDGITNASLLSIGQLCNDNCVAILDKKKIEIFKDNNPVVTGTRNPTDGLWDIPIPSLANSTHLSSTGTSLEMYHRL